MKDLALSADIGSTFTKAALFQRTQGAYTLVDRADSPTTPEELSLGFEAALHPVLPEALRNLSLEELGRQIPIRFSSSAKGGLSIAACGIVPELTAKMAAEAALSAGARITAVYDYRLSEEDLEEINAAKPDILLLAGGTDGGNESYLIHNAEILAGLRRETALIYAGNRRIRGRISRALGGREHMVAENVLPDLDSPAPEDARDKIRNIFLQRIVAGKGLDRLAARLGTDPVPTPYAMLRLIEAVADAALLDEFVLIDMGGATTDVYSVAAEPSFGADRIRRGLPEPRIKRTVEGDLGLRISAAHAVAAIGADEELARYAAALARRPEQLPADERERSLERSLAAGIATAALMRHAGRKRRIFTAAGEAELIRGKDLRSVKYLLTTGGYLSRSEGFKPAPPLTAPGTEEILLPPQLELQRDREYLLPLIANLVFENPREAAASLAAVLIHEERMQWN